MKRIHTFVCCLLMAIGGIAFAIGTTNESKSNSYKTANAAQPLHWAQNVTYPLDLRLNAESESKTKVDTITVRDTIFQDKIVYKYRTRKPASTLARVDSKRKGLDTPVITPDTVPCRDVDVGREENSTDTIGTTKVSIILTVDGEEVYKR